MRDQGGFEILDDPFDESDYGREREEPEGGWKKACTLADHKWALEVEGGQASLKCLDPHPESFADEVAPNHGMPVCLDPYWVSDDITVYDIPVRVRHVDDSTPSTPNGPAEYGFYLDIEVGRGDR